MTSDQFWSFFAMPIGLLVCFGPILIAWILAEKNDSSGSAPKRKR